MRAIGCINGLRGDVFMGTAVARQFKKYYPSAKLILAMHKDFADMAPLFYKHKYYDADNYIHFYDGYDNWPNDIDKDFLAKEKYDMVFNQMPQHTHPEWWKYNHQVQELMLSQGGSLVDTKRELQCSLTQWFDIPDNKKFVALAPIGGWYNYPNKKSLSLERAQEIVDFLLDSNYQVLQIGHKDEPRLEGVARKDLSYFESVKNLLGCKAFITVDTGLTWCASAYSFPTLGLYSNSYYSPAFIKNIQPINPNAQYLDAPNVNEIDFEIIKEKIRDLLK